MKRKILKKYVGTFGILDIKYLQELFYACMPIHVCIKQVLLTVFHELTVGCVIQVGHNRTTKRT